MFVIRSDDQEVADISTIRVLSQGVLKIYGSNISPLDLTTNGVNAIVQVTPIVDCPCIYKAPRRNGDDLNNLSGLQYFIAKVTTC